MANKKITVVGDGAEQPLTPEEEHRLEVRVDKMLDPNVPDETAPAEVPASKPATLQADSAPTVTKIVTKFADDEESDASTPTQPKAEQPKPAAKKITIKHHDEPEDVPAKPAPKPKAAAKKSSKKLKVTIADEPADDLETKADAITASAMAAEEQLVTKDAVEVGQSSEEDTSTVQEPDVSAETSEDSDQGAPPLILKHSAAPIGAAATADDGTENTEPLATPAVAKKITIVHDEEPEEETAKAPENTSDNVEAELADGEPDPAQTIEVAVEEIPEPAEEVTVAVEPDKPAASEEPPKADEASQTGTDDKKYRPPEGPIQFKRAEVPIRPKKPGEPRQEEQEAAELSEDEAIAQAFETKTPSKHSDTARQLLSGLVKTVKWAIIIGVLAAIVAVGAVPTLRHKALKLVGLDNAKQPTASSVVNSNTATAKPSQNIQPAGTDVYLARRAGIYNLYKNDVTGQHEQLVLAGTGKESGDSLALSTNPANTVAALVSTRDGKANASGDYQQSLTFVTVADGTTNVSDTADHIKLVGWAGNTIMYVTYSDSTNTTDANRYQLISYNTATKKRLILDHANYLNDVLAAHGTLYYATASSASGSGEFAKIQSDGAGKTVILAHEIAAITRVSYSTIILSSVDKWYSYELGGSQATQTNTVSQGDGRQYVDSPDGAHSVYSNAAKQLVLYDTKTAKETTLLASGGSYPLHWLNNTTLVYRSDTSDYAITIAGGTPTKVSDVYDTPGISPWHQQ
ncbi:MAG TPA: hypothetical protein VN031_02530 [Candidatus Microsaccharimonas sp.]|nr:hypothetical protein [Candidatus Microsaccharimonas sp.]